MCRQNAFVPGSIYVCIDDVRSTTRGVLVVLFVSCYIFRGFFFFYPGGSTCLWMSQLSLFKELILQQDAI